MLFGKRRPQVVVYTTPTCPDCRALKAWLEARGVPYEERDLSDPRTAETVKKKYGVRVAPVTVVGRQVYYGPFAEQRPKLEAALGKR